MDTAGTLTPVLLPDDPEDWTDEQWLAWLEEGEAAERERQGPARPGLPSWGKAPVPPQSLAASMRAMHDVFYGKRDEPAIVVDAQGDPPGDEPLDVQLNPDHPEESVVIVRPWLLEHRDPEA